MEPRAGKRNLRRQGGVPFGHKQRLHSESAQLACLKWWQNAQSKPCLHLSQLLNDVVNFECLVLCGLLQLQRYSTGTKCKHLRSFTEFTSSAPSRWCRENLWPPNSPAETRGDNPWRLSRLSYQLF